MKQALTGNDAIAQGAIEAGVGVATGYPGAPVSGILEYISKKALNKLYVEWSVNEKVAFEVALGASFSGRRAMCVTKHVGMNVLSDSLNVANLTGVVGGFLIVVGIDPSSTSSQNAMDIRHYAKMAKLPYFEAVDPKEVKELTKYLFNLSEKYKLPVLLGISAKVSHSIMPVEISKNKDISRGKFTKKEHQYVCMPFNTLEKTKELNNKVINLTKEQSKFNWIEGEGEETIITCGLSYNYAKEYIVKNKLNVKLRKISQIYPLSQKIIKEIKNSEKVLVIEEGGIFFEEELKLALVDMNANTTVLGRKSGHVPMLGGLNTSIVGDSIATFVGLKKEITQKPEKVPNRSGDLCKGCPHRASYNAIKKALENHKDAVIVGDRGCYNRAAAPPENLLDICMNMGSSVGIAKGISLSGEQKVVAVMGDSTFFHSGLSSIINGASNPSELTIFILDNSYTGMTGGQPNPGTGKDIKGNKIEKIDIKEIIKSLNGIKVHEVDPYNRKEAEEVAKMAVSEKGVSVVIMKRECVLMASKKGAK